MSIDKLHVNNLRNISKVELQPNKAINIIIGPNGSGKTTLLEAIYLTSLGRSFRTRNNRKLIQFNHEKLVIVTTLFSNTQHYIGIEKISNGISKFKINGDLINSTADLAHLLPAILIHHDSYDLLVGGPIARRQYLDWGVFHVKHSFIHVWKQYQLALKQRNAAIKSYSRKADIEVWNKQLITNAKQIDSMRCEYINELNTILIDIFHKLINIEDISIEYRRGWSKDLELEELLSLNLIKDIELGYTFYGPHRADIVIKTQGKLVQDVLSRGQQKILVIAMLLSQGELLNKLCDKTCVLLIDDLQAELDKERIQNVCNYLNSIDNQIFITGTHEQPYCELFTNQRYDMFHVKHGEFNKVD